MATRSLNVVITGSSRDFSRAMKGVDKDLGHAEGRFKRFSGIAKDAFAGLGVAAAAGLGVAAKATIKTASDINESLTKNQQLFGRHAAEIDKWSKGTARSMGISRAAALEATGTFGNLLVALDIGPGKSAKMSTALVKLAGDLASFNNASPEDAMEAIRSGLVGETEPLRRFGVNMNDATLRTQALAMGLIRTTKEALTPQQRALAANALIMKQTEKAHGDFARTSGGLANQQRILSARIKDISGTIGSALLPAAVKAARALNNLIAETQQGRGPLAALARAVRSVAAAVSDVVGWFRRHRTATTVLMAAVAGLTAAFAAYRIAVIAATAATRAMTIAQGLLTVVMRANPIALVVTAVIALGTALVVAYKRSDTFRRIVNTAFRMVKNGAEEAAGAIKSVVIPVFNTLKSAADKVARGVGAISRAFGAVKGAIGDASDWANPFGDGLGKIPLPSGGSGAGLMGADFDLAPFARIGAGMGLRVSSGLRPGSVTSSGNTSYHSSGDAIDMAGPPSAMGRFFQTMRGMFGSKLRELIYTPGGTGIKDGRPYRYSGQVAQDHLDHVHVAYTGPFGDGIGDIRNLWTRAGGSAAKANLAAAVAMAESSGDPRAFNRNSDGSVDRGLWQINSVHGALSTFDRLGNARAAVRISGGGSNWSPWVAFKSGAYRRFLNPDRNPRVGPTGDLPHGHSGPAEAFRQSQENASLRQGVALRTARRRGGGKWVMGPRGIPVLRGAGSGPLKTGDVSDLSGGGEVEAVSDPAAEALAAAIEASARATEEHTAALNENTAALDRQTGFASQAMTSSSHQAWKALADLMSGQIAGYAVARSFTAGTSKEYAY